MHQKKLKHKSLKGGTINEYIQKYIRRMKCHIIGTMELNWKGALHLRTSNMLKQKQDKILANSNSLFCLRNVVVGGTTVHCDLV